jgi:hypothetical protein
MQEVCMCFFAVGVVTLHALHTRLGVSGIELQSD